MTASFIIPSLPASFFIATPTLDLLATPTGTISAELATQIALTPRPVPTILGGEGCLPESLQISSPRPGTEISGIVEIQGTADIPNFGFYKYEFSPLGSDSWATILADRKPVQDGDLGNWDTSAIATGDYQLRLVVTDNQGNELPACIIPLRIKAP